MAVSRRSICRTKVPRAGGTCSGLSTPPLGAKTLSKPADPLQAHLICLYAAALDAPTSNLAAAVRQTMDPSCTLPSEDGQHSRIVLGSLDLNIGTYSTNILQATSTNFVGLARASIAIRNLERGHCSFWSHIAMQAACLAAITVQPSSDPSPEKKNSRFSH